MTCPNGPKEKGPEGPSSSVADSLYLRVLDRRDQDISHVLVADAQELRDLTARPALAVEEPDLSGLCRHLVQLGLLYFGNGLFRVGL